MALTQLGKRKYDKDAMNEFYIDAMVAAVAAHTQMSRSVPTTSCHSKFQTCHNLILCCDFVMSNYLSKFEGMSSNPKANMLFDSKMQNGSCEEATWRPEWGTILRSTGG